MSFLAINFATLEDNTVFFFLLNLNRKHTYKIQVSEMSLPRDMDGACSIDNILYSAFVIFLRSSNKLLVLLVYCIK